MEYQYDVTQTFASELDEAIQYYESEFTSGGADFLTVFDEVLELILRMPEAGKRVSSKDVDLRARRMRVTSSKGKYAKSFPYLIIYKVYENASKVVLFQLWPERSQIDIREE